jgi:hypothetical protein
MAKDTSLPLETRQRNMVDSVIAPSFVEKLVKARRFKTPLSLRNSIWSARRSTKERPRAQPVSEGVQAANG